jgi:hypothetical protein
MLFDKRDAYLNTVVTYSTYDPLLFIDTLASKPLAHFSTWQ